MSLRKVLIIAIAVCLPAGAAWVLMGYSNYFERAGLKPIASYTRISAGHGCLKVGGNSQDDIVLPEYMGTDSVCLSLEKSNWQLAPGGGGGTVGDIRHRDAPGAVLEMLKSYSIANHKQHAVIEVSRAVRISIRDGHNKPIIMIFNSRPGSTLALAEFHGAVFSAGPAIRITLGAKVTELKVDGKARIGDLEFEYLPANPSWLNHHMVSETPFVVSILESGHPAREEILWPGASLNLPDEEVVIKASREHSPEVTLSSTDPESVTSVTPGQEVRGVAEGTLDQPLTIEDRTYQLLPMTSVGGSGSQSGELVILVRAPKPLDRWRFFLGGPIQSWDDAALFSPYPFEPIAACASKNAA